MKKDRSFSGNIFENSPNFSRKLRSGGGPSGTGDNRERSSTRLRAPTAQDMTIFYIPGKTFGQYLLAGNTKGGSITVQLTSCLTGLESAV
jgi:hypothetical protein